MCICNQPDDFSVVYLCKKCDFPEQVLFYCKKCGTRIVLDVDIAAEVLTAVNPKLVAKPGMIVVQSSCTECNGDEFVVLYIYGKMRPGGVGMRKKLQTDHH